MQIQQRLWLKILSISILIAIGIYYFIRPTAIIVNDTKSTLPAANTSAMNIAAADKTTLQTLPVVQAPASSSSAQNGAPELQQRMAAMQVRRPNSQYTLTDIAAAAARTNSWAATDTVPRELPLTEEEFNDGRQFINVDSLKIETLMPGDQINVQVDPQAPEYQVTIDRVEKHDYNSISWYGHIKADDGQHYQVSFTRGEQLTVGGLDTPDGHFVLQAHGDKGWIASSQLLFKADTSVSDAIHPADVDPNYRHNH